MRIILLCIILISFIPAFGQPRVDIIDMDESVKKKIDDLKICIKETKNNCLPLVNELIEEGLAKNVPYLDYLYFHKAFYYMNRNELDSAILYSNISLQHKNPIEKYRSDLECYNLLANAYYFKGELEKAYNYYIEVSNILENGGDQLHLGYLYSNIATLLGEIGNDEKQIEYLHKSFKLLKENNDDRFIATVSSNLALGYYYQQDTSNVKKWATEALELGEETKDLVGLLQGYFCLSLIEHDKAKSLEYAEKSVLYADSLGDKTHQSSSYYRYAEALNNIGNIKEALNNAEKSIQFSKDIGNITTLSKAALTAANIQYNLGNKDKASEYFHIYAQYNDSILSAENKRLLNNLNAKYETEKKEKQIAEQDLKIQKQQSTLFYSILGGMVFLSMIIGIFIFNIKSQKLKLNQIQKEKENAILNAFILGEERERKRISHDLHDGVAAMIAAAKMSLDAIPHLQKDKQLDQLTKVKGILETTHADIRHIAHNLLPTVLEKEGLIRAATQFAFEINQTKLLNIKIIDNNSNAHLLPTQLQLMLFRVIQELVNNIVKHSKASQAEIRFTQSNIGLQIEIIDDGIGYEIKEGDGNHGLYSITQRLKTIGGNFIIRKRFSGGTEAKVELTLTK